MSKMLILGAGKNQRVSGAFHVDRIQFPGIDKIVDLNSSKWELPSSMHISAIHLIEHLESLINFMDNCWLLLDKGGTLYIETPEAGSNIDLEMTDPTHKRCYRVYSFINYFTPEGIDNFGYTDKPWAFYKCEAKDGVLYVHCSPIK